MQVHTYLAESVADAVSQIRETLGPEAVVLNVRRLPAEGLARLWQKPRIEVLAHVPEKVVTAVPAAPVLDEVQVSALASLRAEMAEMRENLASSSLSSSSSNSSEKPRTRTKDEDEPTGTTGDWRVGSLLEQTGLLPAHAESIVAELCEKHGDAAPVSIADEIKLAEQVLATRWKDSPTKVTGTHVFIGAPGAGKTTALCKWLAQVALVEGRSTAVWRLDGVVANTAESLSVFGEILGVTVERFAPVNGELPEADVLFVDLPGVNHSDANAVAQLARRIATLPDAQVHVVVNGAYETSLLLAQVRAFSKLPITDVIVTHLDEESRWGKVWNLTLGTNCPVRHLSSGQNIPGDFVAASAEQIFSRQFPRKRREQAANTRQTA
jgi:flagellar biosynthesis protein FlhF